MANYTSGFSLHFPPRAERLASFRRIRLACAEANERLGSDYVLEPEAIVEGGVNFAVWPGKQPGQYKCVRIFFHVGKWPWIKNGEADEEDMNRKLGPDERNRLDTKLKALYGAPAFSRAEVVAVAEALQACFPGSRLVRVPSEASLRRDYKRNAAYPSLSGARPLRL